MEQTGTQCYPKKNAHSWRRIGLFYRLRFLFYLLFLSVCLFFLLLPDFIPHHDKVTRFSAYTTLSQELISIPAVYAAQNESTSTAIPSQDATNSTSEEDSANTDPDSITRNDVNVVARELWCPLCSGVRLDVCELKACDQMREEIAIQLENGSTSEEIKSEFLAQYGPQVLGEPPRSGFNWLAWIVPFLVMLMAAFYLVQMRRPRSRLATPDHPASGNLSLSPQRPTTSDENVNGEITGYDTKLREKTNHDTFNYEELLDKELDRYE